MSAPQTAKVQVYSIEYCPFCVAARDLLDQLEVEYELTDMSGDPDRGKVTSAILPGHTTAPLILIDGEPIGGFDELSALHARGEFVRRVFGTN